MEGGWIERRGRQEQSMKEEVLREEKGETEIKKEEEEWKDGREEEEAESQEEIRGAVSSLVEGLAFEEKGESPEREEGRRERTRSQSGLKSRTVDGSSPLALHLASTMGSSKATGAAPGEDSSHFLEEGGREGPTLPVSASSASTSLSSSSSPASSLVLVEGEGTGAGGEEEDEGRGGIQEAPDSGVNGQRSSGRGREGKEEAEDGAEGGPGEGIDVRPEARSGALRGFPCPSHPSPSLPPSLPPSRISWRRSSVRILTPKRPPALPPCLLFPPRPSSLARPGKS
ncbi:hypothetical protein Naga_101118g1, partial [Nannochloropsis gaditana]